jgi:DNA ligase-1
MKFFLALLLVIELFAQKPELFLLKNYTSKSRVDGWVMSEKLDGVRAYWDGEKLISRNGKIFAVPKFFSDKFPSHELDGELWSQRGEFSHIASIVNRKLPHDGWKELTYNVFEVPNATGDLYQRLNRVKKSKYLKVVKQIVISNRAHLENFLKSVEAEGGEGIVVRDATLPYYTGRSKNALKVKSYIDEECEVIKHNRGEGKYAQILGSLTCKMSNKRVIKIGTGFNNSQRENPPKIGAIITFKYYGLTSKGNPRFPVFLRIRK